MLRVTGGTQRQCLLIGLLSILMSLPPSAFAEDVGVPHEYPEIQRLSDSALQERLTPLRSNLQNYRQDKISGLLPSVHQRLKECDSTLLQEWESYRERETHSYSYSQFTYLYSQWLLVVLRHKLQRERPFGFAPQHGQRERIATSLAMSLRRMVAMEFGTWRSGRSGGASGSVTLGKGKLREESFGN
jgi:hypothetical protein